jgi:hypothetical protein
MANTALETEIGHGNSGLTPWSAFVDVTETVPELAWPNSINTYSAMRADAQIASLLLAFTLPIRRYRWYMAPNGARDQVVEDVANDFNLPIAGQDPKPVTRRRDRFSHDRHLFHALLMLTWGSMFFEQVYRYDEASRSRCPSRWVVSSSRSLMVDRPASTQALPFRVSVMSLASVTRVGSSYDVAQGELADELAHGPRAHVRAVGQFRESRAGRVDFARTRPSAMASGESRRRRRRRCGSRAGVGLTQHGHRVGAAVGFLRFGHGSPKVA